MKMNIIWVVKFQQMADKGLRVVMYKGQSCQADVRIKFDRRVLTTTISSIILCDSVKFMAYKRQVITISM